MILPTHLTYHARHSNRSVVSKEGVTQTSSLHSPPARSIAASAMNDVDQADLPAGEGPELQVAVGTADKVHGKRHQSKGKARYLMPACSLLLPDFLKLYALLTCPALARCSGFLSPISFHTSLFFISALVGFLKSSLITITAFHQIIKSPTLSSRLVALSPLFVLCLPRLSLRICIAQVGPLRLSSPFSPNILCVFFFFPSLSRISRPSSRASTTLGDLVARFEGTP